MNWIEYFHEKCLELEAQKMLREFQPRLNPCGAQSLGNQGLCVNWSSNDYLGLASHPQIQAHAHAKSFEWGNGSGGSRHLGGDIEYCHQLEAKIAVLHHSPSALIVNTGYQANLALGSCIAPKEATIFADELCHASFWDGIRMGGTRFQRYKHCNTEHLRLLLSKCHGPKVIATESVFSMDGDLAPLREIAQIAEEFSALLIVDEAHADGLFGSEGRGFCSDLRQEFDLPILSLSTFGKAYGVFGAAICAPVELRTWLIQKARPLIYSTFMSPWNLGAMEAALDLAHQESWRRHHTLELAQFLRSQLQELGLHCFNSQSQIVPIALGEAGKALEISQQLRKCGHLCHPVRPPTVPEHSSRLRINVCAFHEQAQLEDLVLQLKGIL